MRARTLPTLAAFAAALSLAPAAAQAAEPLTELASRADGALGAPADSFAHEPSVSADGRYVTFTSAADNLSALDDDSVTNVYLRDRLTGTTVLVSRNGAQGGDADSTAPVISADGRFVAYDTAASNLSGADQPGFGLDVLVYDVALGTNALASRADGVNGLGGTGHSHSPSISADGSRVAFQSHADNLSAIDQDAHNNIFVRDMVAGTTELVSQGAAAADDSSYNPAISGNGQVVGFSSDATNLGDANPGFRDVFTRNVETDVTTYVSRATGPGGVAGAGSSDRPSLSHDGRFVAFDTEAPNLVSDDVDAAARRVLRRDRLSQTTILVSRATGANGAANTGFAGRPSISAGGGAVAFVSQSALAPDADPGVGNVYVRQVVGGTTTLVSRASGDAGAAGDGASDEPSLSADGATVAFSSVAGNLTADAVGANEVFVRAPAPVAPPQGDGGGGGGGQPAPDPVVVPAPEAPVVEAPVTPPAPETSAPTAPKLRMKLVRLTATKAKVRVSCLAGECRGTLRVKRPSGKGRILGRATFSVSAGAKRKVVVRLRKPSARPKVQVAAVVRPAGLPKTVVTKTMRATRR
ncbi:MAG TPA: hypothetical protein VIL49_10110 [Capillimicrobium sp.]|jgi:Tol biopolymer transport system component